MPLHLGEAFKIMIRTYPFVILRALLIILFAMGVLVYIGFLIWLFLKFQTWMILIIGIISLIVLFFIWRLFSRYVLYLYKAAHIAVIAELAQDRDIPSFFAQLKFGVNKVKNKFLSVSGLYIVDEAINGVLSGFNMWVRGMILRIPFAPLQNILQFFVRVINLAISYIDEAIVCYIFMNERQDAWVSARDGLVLYAKNWKGILITSIILVSLAYFLAFVALMAANFIGTPFTVFVPGSIAKEMVLVIALVIAFVLYSAILNPLTLCAIIVTYVEEIKDDTPDSKTMDFLAGISAKFREIMSRAAGRVTGKII